MVIGIRPMTAGDRAEIIKILLATLEFTSEEVKVAEELIDLYLQYGTNSEYHILIAEVDTILAGYICYGPTPLTQETWDIYWIAVSADRQNMGIGRTLLSSAENEIAKVRGRIILIETSSKEQYQKTRCFYKNLGYEQVARIPDFYAPGDDKLVYKKTL